LQACQPKDPQISSDVTVPIRLKPNATQLTVACRIMIPRSKPQQDRKLVSALASKAQLLTPEDSVLSLIQELPVFGTAAAV
jgi:hypothetical protein